MVTEVFNILLGGNYCRDCKKICSHSVYGLCYKLGSWVSLCTVSIILLKEQHLLPFKYFWIIHDAELLFSVICTDKSVLTFLQHFITKWSSKCLPVYFTFSWVLNICECIAVLTFARLSAEHLFSVKPKV